VDVSELLERGSLYVASLPRGVRVAAYLVAGLSLTGLAVRRFEHELVVALACMGLAVVFFWLVIAELM
jgi:hypothetical protein